MTYRRSPAFQFYPLDFVGDMNVRMMTNQERGFYIMLLCHCWLEGSLPDDAASLAMIVGEDLAEFKASWPRISRCFQVKEGRLIQKRLEIERENQRKFSKKQSRNAEKRWEKQALPSEPRYSQKDAMAEPKVCSSSSSSSSSSSNKEAKERIALATKGAASATEGEPKADFTLAVEYLMETWKAGPGSGQRYPFSGIDGKAVKRIVGNYGLVYFKALWSEFLARDWKWINNTNQTVTPPKDLRVFESKLVELLEHGGYKNRIPKITSDLGLNMLKMKR